MEGEESAKVVSYSFIFFPNNYSSSTYAAMQGTVPDADEDALAGLGELAELEKPLTG